MTHSMTHRWCARPDHVFRTPVLVVTSPMMARVSRHRIITVGSISLQSTALVLMCRLFLTRSSEYYKLSSMANMGTIVGLSGSGGSGSVGGKAMG